VALKIELKPGERVMLGDCVITNQGRRTRLTVDGAVPILREAEIMTLSEANTPAKRLYLAVQFIYLAKEPQEHYALYFRLAKEMLQTTPSVRPFIESINNRILTGDMYKALKEARKLIAQERSRVDMNHAAKAYAKTVRETAPPRELEASLLLKAAAKLQAVDDSWQSGRIGFDDAVLYNRRLWTVFLDSLIREDNKLPSELRQNLTRLGMFIMSETVGLMTSPTRNQLKAIINVNRGIATGLRGKGGSAAAPGQRRA
jgi:flagellar biosynthesis repressor protein FlbT